MDRKPGVDRSSRGDGPPRSRISLPAHRSRTAGRQDTTLPASAKFDMPKLETNRLPVPTAEQLRQIVKVCNVGDKAIVLFVADSGPPPRRVINLNWSDVDQATGLVREKQGKKGPSAVMGGTTRRALLAYRRPLSERNDKSPLFQTRRALRP